MSKSKKLKLFIDTMLDGVCVSPPLRAKVDEASSDLLVDVSGNIGVSMINRFDQLAEDTKCTADKTVSLGNTSYPHLADVDLAHLHYHFTNIQCLAAAVSKTSTDKIDIRRVQSDSIVLHSGCRGQASKKTKTDRSRFGGRVLCNDYDLLTHVEVNGQMGYLRLEKVDQFTRGQVASLTQNT